MILTVLEARVAAANVEALRSAYSVLAAGPLPPGLVSSRLIQAEDDPSLWRLETLWQDREAIERMRAKGTPGGVLLFRERPDSRRPASLRIQPAEQMEHA
jgi:hypothetical protein